MLGNKKTTKQKKSSTSTKPKVLPSFARALLWTGLLYSCLLFAPLWKFFPKHLKAWTPRKVLLGFRPPTYTWANWSSLPVMGGFPRGIFWNEQLFSSSLAFLPLTPNRVDFSLPTNEHCQSSPEIRQTWQAAAQFGSLERCTPALSHCCHAHVWLRVEI